MTKSLELCSLPSVIEYNLDFEHGVGSEVPETMSHTTQRHPEEIQMTSYVGCSEIQRTYGTFQHTSCGLQLEVKISRFYSSCGRQSYDTLRIFKDLRTTVVGCLLELNDALRMRLGCIQEFVG